MRQETLGNQCYVNISYPFGFVTLPDPETTCIYHIIYNSQLFHNRRKGITMRENTRKKNENNNHEEEETKRTKITSHTLPIFYHLHYSGSHHSPIFS
jgi:hypothetical protein